jgi:hypothetical protein
MNTLLTKNYTAGAPVAARRFVKLGAADNIVVPGAAADDGLLGVSADLGAETGARLDVRLAGIAEIELGDNVTRGDLATSDAAGRGVTATLAVDEIIRTGGIFLASGAEGDIVPVLLAPAAAVGALHAQTGGVFAAAFTIGAEADHVRRVSIQLKDDAGADLAIRGSVFAYLSDDANGDSIAAAAPSGGAVIGADGIAIPAVAGKAFHLVSEADGDIDLDITEAAAKSFHLVIVLPTGALAVSAAITFAG